MKKIIRSLSLGDMHIYYVIDEKTQISGLVVLPESLNYRFCLAGEWEVENLVQVKAVGDNYPVGFSHGHTMRNGETALNLCYFSQSVDVKGDITEIETILTGKKLRAIHTLQYKENTDYLTILTEIENKSDEDILIEMISSYSICGFSPIEEAERMEDFYLYRLQSKWSAEGRLNKESFTDLQLEPSWQRYGVQSIRYGETGSMPVRRYFPWLVVEDSKYGYCIGSQLYYAGSWQMELYSRDDKAAISGGLADREFGHWMKRLRKRERFSAPKAVVSVCKGDIDDISYRLVSAQEEGIEGIPEAENKLPVVFNEFCTTWGNPTCQNMLKIVDTIKNKGITYCVIDAGWYSVGEGDWNADMGDWVINENRFKGGFAKTVKAIKDAKMIPGLWFEMECVGSNTEGFKRENWQLKRDNVPIQTGFRRFWDMRNPEVIEYLSDRVIGILKKYGFGYLKVDYNDNIGIGCDGAESLGEGLRQYIEGCQSFLKKIRKDLPNLVIENCSSGGHRLEPSMQAITNMSSFSDAHECVTIPIIAANVQRAILPKQSQIWAVLRALDDDKRLYYSMVNTLFGRMCLSGDIYDLSKEQWSIVERGIEFYKKSADIIKNGKSKRQGTKIVSYNYPTGWQSVIRKEQTLGECGRLLIVVHRFFYEAEKNIPSQNEIDVTLPSENWSIQDIYGRNHLDINVVNNILEIKGMEEMEAVGIIMTNK